MLGAVAWRLPSVPLYDSVITHWTKENLFTELTIFVEGLTDPPCGYFPRPQVDHWEAHTW